MKAIILAAGYATRLYPLTMNTPKPLLEIAGKTILDHIFDELATIDDIKEVYIVTNHKFHTNFIQWMQGKNTDKKIMVIDDGTLTNEDRLGAIGDIRLVIEKEKIEDDIMVLAGDNIFTFHLLDFYTFFSQIQKDCICVHELNDRVKLKRTGVALLDEHHRVLEFEEKPENPKSTMAVPPFYIYTKDTLSLFGEYMDAGNNSDAPGNFITWLCNKKAVYGFQFTGERYDIGTIDSYNEVQKLFSENKTM